MTDLPKTIEEARKYKYSKNEYGLGYYSRYKPGSCAWEVGEPPWYIYHHQCLRKNGHGINGLYCKQHALIVERMMKK